MQLLRIDIRIAGVPVRVLTVNLELYRCKMEVWWASAQDKREGKKQKNFWLGFSKHQMS